MLLAGKKVVVVGGSWGIGLATAEMAKREGADVIIASRDAERLDKVAETLNAIAIPADVTSDDSVAELFRRCGPVDHVVVTAAQLRTGPFKTVAMEDVRGTMEGKFWGDRSAPRCRKRRASTCWRRPRRRCRSAASALARISHGKSSASWPTVLRPDRSSISTVARWSSDDRGGHHGIRKQRRLHPQHRRSAMARIPQSFRRRAV